MSIIKLLRDSFYGDLATAFPNFREILCVNNLLYGHILLLLLGLATHYHKS